MEQNNKHYLTNKELHKISKENIKITKAYEKKKHRKNVPESEYVTSMKDDNNIIEIEDVNTYFFVDTGVVKAVNGVSFNIKKGSVVGVVGESGCGKSVTSLSIMQLVQSPQGQIVSGSIRYHGLDKTIDIAKTPLSEMQKIRGKEIAMIFQEPMTSLNPVFTIGYQLDEVSFLHIPHCTKEQAKTNSIKMMETVGIARANEVYYDYPHQLSGGMRQRVMIAMALICSPRLIIADEPTTALDVTIQAQILDLLREIKDRMDGSIMLITHDLGVIAEMADYVVVMYAGKVVEQGSVQEIFHHPLHPYTLGLQKSKPVVNQKVERLYNIPGNVPNPINMPDYCFFKDRCPHKDQCNKKTYPELIKVSETHYVACHLIGENDYGK